MTDKPANRWLTSLAWPGAPLAILSAVLFGASTPLAKLLLGGGVSPWLLAGVLYLGSGVGLSLVYLVRGLTGIGPAEASLKRADLPWLALVVLTGGVVGPVLLMIGLASTPASSAALLLNLEGLATMTIAWLVFRENVDRRLLLGASAILAGAVLISWQGGPSGVGLGALAIAGACLAWGIDNNLTRKLSSADPVQIALIKGLVAGSVNLALALTLGARLPPLGPLAGAAVVGFFGYGVSLALFVLGLRFLGAARTGAYFSAAPFIGAILSLLIFREPLTARLIAAGGLMALGLYLHLTERHSHTHAHEALDHSHAHVHDAHHHHEHAAGDPGGEPHSHPHHHAPLRHKHPHYPDLHHRHDHTSAAGAKTMVRFEPRLLLAAVAALGLWSCDARSAAGGPPLVLERTIPLAGVKGRIDHLAVDTAHGRLFVAELGNDSVEALDIASGRSLGRVSGLGEPQGLAYLADRDELAVATGGDGMLRFYRAADLSLAGSVKLGEDADNVRVDQTSGKVVVGYGSGALAVIDPATRRVLGKAAMPAHPEGFQLEGGWAYVNVPDAGRIEVVDIASGRQLATWPNGWLKFNFSLALDPSTATLASVFRFPAMLGIFDIASGARRQTLPTCGDVDDVFFDHKRKRLYVVCGAGQVDVFQAGGKGYARLDRLKTRSGARTGFYAPELDRLFVAARAGAEPAAILVYRPAS